MRRIAAILVVMIVVGICGCTQAPSQAKEPAKYERHVVVCPNPDCQLHDPNGKIAQYSTSPRPIDLAIYDGAMEPNQYLCQVCGERWSE